MGARVDCRHHRPRSAEGPERCRLDEAVAASPMTCPPGCLFFEVRWLNRSASGP